MTESVQPSHRNLASAVLRRAGWFSTCKAETLQTLLDEGQLRLIKRGEILTRRGEPVDHLCLIIDGVLEVSATTAVGKRHVVRYLEPGQLMNLIPVLDEQGAIHDAVAHMDTLVLLLGSALVQRTLANEPELALSLMRLLCLRSRLTYANLTESSLATLRTRCARTLLHLLDPYGMPRNEGVAISLKLSQDEFADMVGRSRPTVNRELKQLERDGIIRITYSHFLILDVAALNAVAADL
ncbi:Crp/Fnr family transcriptional regulator [Cupriavidus taiwanensis]|uniref:Crp/Fnr family transcriptional regulator n=1 Tax=Cupriavidus taiwanensis TaxID=164546 RepID=A0A375BHY3_9BURK|nr:Crp/Fnr family transcriptional regulator [Cupriavidus taiwanensis]MDK3023147.1 Crp/Fnr family transcriptional regulator [Cupriavidus taiwanensis]SOY45953.1 Crp/Fnr family transcriptional regulator [Cupriavidus taiwanensis]